MLATDLFFFSVIIVIVFVFYQLKFVSSVQLSSVQFSSVVTQIKRMKQFPIKKQKHITLLQTQFEIVVSYYFLCLYFIRCCFLAFYGVKRDE